MIRKQDKGNNEKRKNSNRKEKEADKEIRIEEESITNTNTEDALNKTLNFDTDKKIEEIKCRNTKRKIEEEKRAKIESEKKKKLDEERLKMVKQTLIGNNSGKDERKNIDKRHKPTTNNELSLEEAYKVIQHTTSVDERGIRTKFPARGIHSIIDWGKTGRWEDSK